MRPFGEVINESNDAYDEFSMPNDWPIDVIFDWNNRWTCWTDGFSVADGSTAAVLDGKYVFEIGVACVVCLVYGLRCPMGCAGSGGNDGIT